jgi:hypothetical protein
MKIPLLIGKNSSGKNQFVDLSEVPVLMVSYCNENQLNSLFGQFNLYDGNYIITNSRRLARWGISNKSQIAFLRDEPESGLIESRDKLIKMVLEEIIVRRDIMKKKKIESFSRYFELNTWNEQKLDYLFLLIDDVWDIVVSKPKKLALNFMMSILYGPSVGIHTIFASTISYRNLLQQLVQFHPILTLELQKRYGKPEPRQINNLGHEIIFTQDELIYYKKANIMDMERFYKI